MFCRHANSRALQIVLALSLTTAFFAPVNAHAKHRVHKRSHRAAAIHKAAPVVPFSTVVIDAGHGGMDAGGIRQNIIPEKNVALDVAKRVENTLRKSGLRTVMTRRDDRFIPLDTRVAIANSYRDAIFL
ncbi:MAG: N-acetylmuramoyl-L-alanine amidase, partial [Verrucomicrobiota bacterium]|nr:N-acetylmuramoyl-L-alanine amidase [Verrucomicrobiota bacterium]